MASENKPSQNKTVKPKVIPKMANETEGPVAETKRLSVEPQTNPNQKIVKPSLPEFNVKSARVGFIYSEVLGKPLALRRRK